MKVNAIEEGEVNAYTLREGQLVNLLLVGMTRPGSYGVSADRLLKEATLRRRNLLLPLTLFHPQPS